MRSAGNGNIGRTRNSAGSAIDDRRDCEGLQE